MWKTEVDLVLEANWISFITFYAFDGSLGLLGDFSTIFWVSNENDAKGILCTHLSSIKLIVFLWFLKFSNDGRHFIILSLLKRSKVTLINVLWIQAFSKAFCAAFFKENIIVYV